MADVLSPKVKELVQQELATGRYTSADDVLLHAMELLRERDTHLAQFRAGLHARLQRLEAGEGIDLDDDTLDALLDEIEAQVCAEVSAKRD